MPPNGLVIYCGTIVTDEGKEKKVVIHRMIHSHLKLEMISYFAAGEHWLWAFQTNQHFSLPLWQQVSYRLVKILCNICAHKPLFVCFLIVSLYPEALTALLADDNRFGFIVMDGNGALFGTLQVWARVSLFRGYIAESSQGNTRDVLHKFTVDLPKKHGIVFYFV